MQFLPSLGFYSILTSYARLVHLSCGLEITFSGNAGSGFCQQRAPFLSVCPGTVPLRLSQGWKQQGELDSHGPAGGLRVLQI